MGVTGRLQTGLSCPLLSRNSSGQPPDGRSCFLGALNINRKGAKNAKVREEESGGASWHALQPVDETPNPIPEQRHIEI
jgi:hypothetical protein